MNPTKSAQEVTKKHELNNTSDRFLIVGNYHAVISHHSTAEEANEAFRSLDLAAKERFSLIQIVAPGETVSGEMVSKLWIEMTEEEVDAEYQVLLKRLGVN